MGLARRLSSWGADALTDALPLALNLLFGLHLSAAGLTGPKPWLFALFVIIASLSPRCAIIALAAIAPLWESLTLALGLPNHFLIEAAVIGTAGGWTLYKARRPKADATSETLAGLAVYPMTLPLLFAALMGWVWGLLSLGPLIIGGSAPYNLATIFDDGLVGAFLWQAEGNPFHGLSIAIGFSAHLALIANIVRYRETLKLEGPLPKALIVSAILTAAYTLGQRYLSPLALGESFAIAWGGPFQNGNHLSFFGGIIILVALWGSREPLAPAWRAAGALTGTVLLWWGLGRTAWVALAVGAAAGLIGSWRSPSAPRRHLALYWGLGATAVLILLSQFLPRLTGTLVQMKSMFAAAIRLGDISFLLPGRWPLILDAAAMIRDKGLTGIGLGHFFAYSGRGVDQHNAYLAWLAELGVGAGLVALLAGGVFLHRVRRGLPPALMPALLAMGGYFLVTHLGDYFLSYRSLALIMALAFLPIVTALPRAGRLPRWQEGAALLVVAAGIALPLAAHRTVTSPLPLATRHSDEWGFSGAYRWHGPLLIARPQPQSCYLDEVSGYRQSLELTVGRYNPSDPPRRFWSRHEQLAWEKGVPRQTVYLPHGHWQRICLCRPPGSVEAGGILPARRSLRHSALGRELAGWGSPLHGFAQPRTGPHPRSKRPRHVRHHRHPIVSVP